MERQDVSNPPAASKNEPNPPFETLSESPTLKGEIERLRHLAAALTPVLNIKKVFSYLGGRQVVNRVNKDLI